MTNNKPSAVISLTQVAPLPIMHESEAGLDTLGVAPGSPLSAPKFLPVYTAKEELKGHLSSPSANGSANSAETISEPSTRDSGDSSSRSAATGSRTPKLSEGSLDCTNYLEEPEERVELGSDPSYDQQGSKINTAEEATLNTVSNEDDRRLQESQSRRKPSESAARSTASASRRAMVAAAELTDDVLVGTRVSEGHENFVTAYNMLTGIRVAVSRCTAKVNRPLTDRDFSVTDNIDFDLSGGGSNPSSKYIFQFKDYAPWVFRHLRDVFRLDPADYLMSLTAKYIVSELGSPGKSGSFFYYSRDYRFIIKTIRHSEHKLLRRILRQYFSHVKSNPDTLISQFYGLHRVKLPFGRKIHFVVMNNVFPALYEIHERFDLKGSLLGREYHPDLSKPIVVYKDLDWLRKHRRMVLGPQKREKLVKQLELDTRFLERVNVMDYSLLVGIHDMTKGNAALKALLKLEEFGPKDAMMSEAEKRDAKAAVHNQRHRGTAEAQGKADRGKMAQKDFADLQTLLKKATPEKLKEFDFADEYRSEFFFYRDHGGYQSTDDHNDELDVIYYIGVIDFLTGYTFRKSVETFCKSLIHDRKELSAVPSGEYGERFMRFIRGSIGPAIPSSKPQKRQTLDSVSQPPPATPPHHSRSVHQGERVERDPGFHPSREDNMSSQPSMMTPSPPKSSSEIDPQPSAVTSPSANGATMARGTSPVKTSTRPSVAGYGSSRGKEH